MNTSYSPLPHIEVRGYWLGVGLMNPHSDKGIFWGWSSGLLDLDVEVRTGACLHTVICASPICTASAWAHIPHSGSHVLSAMQQNGLWGTFPGGWYLKTRECPQETWRRKGTYLNSCSVSMLPVPQLVHWLQTLTFKAPQPTLRYLLTLYSRK